jgi:hypothetical protein
MKWPNSRTQLPVASSRVPQLDSSAIALATAEAAATVTEGSAAAATINGQSPLDNLQFVLCHLSSPSELVAV